MVLLLFIQTYFFKKKGKKALSVRAFHKKSFEPVSSFAV